MASDQETTGRILAGFPDSVPIDELQESVQEQASLQMHAATYFTQDLRSETDKILARFSRLCPN